MCAWDVIQKKKKKITYTTEIHKEEKKMNY